MANYNSFLFEGHGYSEKTGGYDPGATNGAVKENDLVDAINKAAKKYLDTTTFKHIKAEFKGVEFEISKDSYIEDIFDNFYAKYDEMYGITSKLFDLGLK